MLQIAWLTGPAYLFAPESPVDPSALVVDAACRPQANRVMTSKPTVSKRVMRSSVSHRDRDDARRQTRDKEVEFAWAIEIVS
jgi:hypothetical protein